MALALGLHFDGANNSTVFTDVSGKTVASRYGAIISTMLAAPLTGNTTSGYFDGYAATKHHITFAPSADLNAFGTADFSISGWIYSSDWYNYQAIIYGGYNGIHLLIEDYALILRVGGVDIVSYTVTEQESYDNNYFAVWRVGGTTYLAVNGTVRDTVTTAYSINDPTADFVIGREGTTVGGLAGFIDDLLIATGDSQFTTAAPVPTAPFVYVEPPASGETIELPISITAYDGNVIVLPISVATVPHGNAGLPLAVSVVPASLLAGAASVCVGVGAAAVWAPVVTLGGVDITTDVIGDIRVEADEGTARIAEFIIRPASGTVVSLAGWTGRAVTIDVADNSSGTPVNAMRLFSGVVDTPELDPVTRTIALRCTDDLQGVCQAMSNAALKALIGGYESSAVFDPAAIGWAYAQDRLSTVPASLDISPLGQLRITPWTAKATPDITLDADLIGDGSLGVQIAERSALTNEVNVAFDYRFPRIKAECYSVNYTLVDMTGFAQFVLDGKWFLQRAQVESAIESAGGTIESITWEPLPTWNVAVGDGFFTPSEADLDLCMGFSADVSFDYAQTVEEQHRIRVHNALSIAAVGLRADTLTGALEGDYPDLVAVETGITLYKKEITGTPPKNKAVAVSSATTSVTGTLTDETDRAAANKAMEALIAIAKTKIHASHRASRVSAVVPLIPALDVDKTVRIEADGLAAQGKVVSVAHALSAETGSATSTATIALCSLAGVGITHDQDPTTAPDGTGDTTTPVSGTVSVTFNAGATEDHVITVTFPEVDEAERSTAEIEIPSAIAAPIDEDEFTLTL